MFRTLFLTAGFVGIVLAHSSKEHVEEPEIAIEPEIDVIAPKQGDICNINQALRPAAFDNQFFECLIPTADRDAWIWPQLGIWVVKNCSQGYTFSPTLSACKAAETTTVRRHQACGPAGCGGQQIVVPSSSSFGGGCGAGGCGYQPPQQQVIYQPPQPVYQQPQPVYQQPQPVYQPQQPIYQPQQQSYGQPCGPQGCQPQPVYPPVQPVYPVQPSMPAPCGVPGPNPCPTPCGQPQCPRPVVKRPCPQSQGCGGQSGGSCGGYCSWMIDPLRPGQGTGYSQCVPVPNPVSEFCGQWRPRKCGYGSRFHPQAQVCIRDPSVRPRPGPQRPQCPQQQIPIGSCNSQQQCPGYSQCQPQTNTCCQAGQFSG